MFMTKGKLVMLLDEHIQRKNPHALSRLLCRSSSASHHAFQALGQSSRISMAAKVHQVCHAGRCGRKALMPQCGDVCRFSGPFHPSREAVQRMSRPLKLHTSSSRPDRLEKKPCAAASKYSTAAADHLWDVERLAQRESYTISPRQACVPVLFATQ